MEIFLIRCGDPLDMEGHPEAIAVFTDSDLAEETVDALNAKDEEMARASWGDRWQSFILRYTVERMTVSTSVNEVVEATYEDCYKQ